MNSHFLMALSRHEGGAVVEAADDALTQVVEAVHRTGKKGTVTVKLTVGPNGEMGKEVTFDVAAKAPQLAFGKSFYWPDEAGQLTREPPREEIQRSMRLMNGGQADE